MKRYLIPSLLAAGFIPNKGQAMSVDIVPKSDDFGQNGFFYVFKSTQNYTLAGHSSHASHGSHGSHRSSSGGGIYVPRVNPTPPQQVLPSVPKAPKVLPGNSPRFKQVLTNVQICLYLNGYYQGAINGILDTETSVAITKAQLAWRIQPTGTLTSEVLTRCGISIY